MSTSPRSKATGIGTSKYTEAHWFVQSRPFVNPLPYTAVTIKVSGSDSRFPGPLAAGPSSWMYLPMMNEHSSSEGYGAAYKTAYDRFIKNAKSSQSVGLALVEGKKSLEMISARTAQLISLYRHCRKGDIEGITRDLGLHNARKKKPRVQRAFKKIKGYHNPNSPSFIRDENKRAASSYLEVIFGWKPLIQDIGGAVETLQREFPTEPITGSGSRAVESKKRIGPEQKASDIEQSLILTKVRIKGQLRVSNPNLLLANELGFVNPLQVAWEVVPFSFLVDMFIPINRFLGSFTDLCGLSIDRLFVTSTKKGMVTQDYTYYVFGQTVSISKEEQGTSIQRRTLASLPIPGLLDRVKFPTPSLSLAATMTALAVQVFSGSSR